MPRFTKKPVTIEAVCWDGVCFVGGKPTWIEAYIEREDADDTAPQPEEGQVINCGDKLYIGTLEGTHMAQPGDMIIRGVKGEIYPCKPDIFDSTYYPEPGEPQGPLVHGLGNALDLIRAEVVRAVKKFPTWPSNPLEAAAVVGEEAGELTKASIQSVYEKHKGITHDDLLEEAVLTAAMAVRYMMSIHAYDYEAREQHEQTL